MAAAYGIHFGATSACIGACRDGKTDVVANDAGDRVTPAIVAFTDCDQAVGAAAKQGLIRNAANTICHVKRLLGRGLEEMEVQEAIANGPVKIISKNDQLAYEVEYKEKRVTFSPTQIASSIYKKMMETAESHGGQSDAHDAVITVPISFTQQQRLALCEAAEEAGFNVLRVINEPTAAVLAYDIGQSDPQQECNVLVYRVGGTSQDITVLHVSNGMYKTLASAVNNDNGGRHIDELLVNHFAAEFQRQWKCDCRENKRSISKLRNASETCKHILSTMPSSQVSVDSLFEGIDFQSNMSRGRFEGLCGSFVQNCVQPLSDVLSQAGLTKEEVHKVIVCGGTAKMALLQKQLRDCLPQSELLCSIPPDEVIAIGAAKQCALLVDSEEEELLRNEQQTEVPCLDVEIIMKTIGEEGDHAYHTIFSRRTPVPARRQHRLSLMAEQTSLCLEILQRSQSEPSCLAKIVMTELPAASQITAVFHIRSDGSLHITCTEPSTKKEETVLVEPS